MSNPRRRLDTAELADASVTAALVISLLTVGRILAAGSFFQVMATVVVAVLAARRRLRAVVAATAASTTLAVLLGGLGPISQAALSGLYGWPVGLALRHRWGRARTIAACSVVAWPIVAAGSVAILAIFSELRELSLETGRNQWLGIARPLERMGLEGLAADGTAAVDWSIEHWYVMVPALEAAITIVYALVVRSLGRVVLQQVAAALGPPVAGVSPEPPTHPPAPVPMAVTDVEVERGPTTVRLPGLNTTVRAGSLLAVTGPNGAGKTSLLAAMAGMVPSRGISHDGPVGLGQPGGASLISQRPETQVLGVRVIDDLRWGRSDLEQHEIDAALTTVGMSGLADRATGELSGGELQRLAIAAALVRHPRLLLSDESTAMLDPAGRTAVLELLATMAGKGTAVVHSTHLRDDLATFDHHLGLDRDRAPHRSCRSRRPAAGHAAILEATAVAHVHADRTPWATRALHPVDLRVSPGELVLVTGPNGSGKTTLARALAGLIRPTEGEILLHGQPLTGPDLRIGIAFQHARLQLLRPTVADEIRAASGRRDIDEALELVGFVPTQVRHRRIDDLSGGEQRRVLLAGVVARHCEVAILDEPLAGLDEPGREQLAAIIDLVLERGTGVIMVTHDPEWAAPMAHDTVSLDGSR